MSNQLFQQNLDDKKGPQPGGPYLIQILFKEPVDMPDKETKLLRRELGVRRRGRVDDEALDVRDVGQQGEDLQVVQGR